jgi:sugar transferase (PEP-CTERM/EpsH1 system associated)
MGRLSVLALVTRLPVPPWRGDQVRSYHHLRLLARRHDVTLAVVALGRTDAEAVAATRALGLRVEVIELGWAGAPIALAPALLGDARPLQVLLYARRRAIERVAALCAATRFDVVHAQLVRTAAFLPPLDGPRVVLDLIDALSSNFDRRAARDRGPLAWISAIEARRLRRTEAELAARAACTLVVSAREQAQVDGPRVVVVPNGVDLDAFPMREHEGTPGRIVFTGNLGYFPNVDAARWLAAEVMPRVRAELPSATLHLAGARPAPAIRALAGRDGVSLAADVPAMAPELASGAITVIPMRSGSGLQNKVLEAMAVGTPVVTTSGVASALDMVAGEHLLVADTADEIAAAAVGLLSSPSRRQALAERARRRVEERYRWEDSAAAVESAWLAAAAARR